MCVCLCNIVLVCSHEPVFLLKFVIKLLLLLYSRCSRNVLFSLNSIYFQISIYTWQHTSIQIHGQWIGKQVT